jgi:hypothetical protein
MRGLAGRRQPSAGRDWVLCCDADERYETLFSRSLASIAVSSPEDELTCISVSLGELWDGRFQYRVDGV